VVIDGVGVTVGRVLSDFVTGDAVTGGCVTGDGVTGVFFVSGDWVGG
jgi:hypothetical protein